MVVYRAGGALDTVIEGTNELFFDKQSSDALIEALMRVDSYEWDPAVIRQTAERFSRSRFEERMKQLLTMVVHEGRKPIEPVALPVEMLEKGITQ